MRRLCRNKVVNLVVVFMLIQLIIGTFFSVTASAETIVVYPTTNLSISEVTASEGEEITIPVMLGKGKSLSAAQLQFEYNKQALKFIKGSIEAETLSHDFVENSSGVKATFILNKDIVSDASMKLITLTFKVLAKTGEYTIGFGNYSLINSSYNTIQCYVSGGKVKVISRKLADISGDGVISIVDATQLFFYTSGRNTNLSSAQLSVADVNKDGKVNVTDCLKIFHYVSGRISSLESEPTVAVTGISLNKSSLSLRVGESISLIATIAPANASNKAIKWSSSNTSIATVDNAGQVVCKANGVVMIMATSVDGAKVAKCTLTVTTSPTVVTLNTKTAALKVGGTTILKATVSPSTASNKDVTWSSSNTAVATVDSTGKVIAKGNGSAVITVKTVEGAKTATCTVTVTTSPTGVTITNKKNVHLDVKNTSGKTYQCSISVAPSTASNKSVTWSSNNTGVATVSSSGLITAVGRGTAVITVKTVDGAKTDTIDVYVYESNVTITTVNNIWYSVRLKASTDKVMDVHNGITSNGSKVQLYNYHGGEAQLWQFHDYRSTHGGFAIVPKCNSGSFILDVNRGTSYSTPFAENNLIDLWTLGQDNAASMWQLVRLWDDSYIFKLINTNWVAGVTVTDAGAQLMLRKFDVTDQNQRWVLEAVNTSTSTNSGIEKAISWAQTQKNNNNMSYCYWCLKFVGDAFRAGGIQNAGYATATQAGNALITNTDKNPPRGAVVFWNWYGTIDGVYANYGHVGISLGNGQVIHADYNGIKITSIDLGGTRTYRGYGTWR